MARIMMEVVGVWEKVWSDSGVRSSSSVRNSTGSGSIRTDGREGRLRDWKWKRRWCIKREGRERMDSGE